MSLDVYLRVPDVGIVGPGSCIFIREDGQIKEISREEWDERFPDQEPYTIDFYDEVYKANITHNLNKMAEEAGIYEALWRPEELGIDKAGQLVEPLRKGLQLLVVSPEYFEGFNPKNGWGDYYGLVRFVQNYLDACEKYPDALIEVSR